MNSIPAIRIRNLTVSYGGKPVLVDVSLDVPRGSVIGILGPNGGGKSTLIKSVMGFVDRDFGEVELFGEKVQHVRGRVAYVPQRSQIDWNFPVSVRDTVMMGRYQHVPWYRSFSRKDREIARQALEDVKMLPFAGRQIGELSGGQQQRVFMARALAQQSDILLLDEPFAGVDAATERAIAGLLAASREQGKTVMVVHHDLETAAEFFDLVVIVNKRFYAYGRPAEVMDETLLSEVYGGKLRNFSWMKK
jgi:manganese/iron transport system ATP-binding protein/manganese/zinc/iron transport system ATP- binding protein